HLRPPILPQRMADDARLWFIFTKLNIALQELEVQKLHAMPPHEREARFKSACLVRRLAPPAVQPVLTPFGLAPLPYRHVYELHPRSSEVRASEGDFTFALSPLPRAGFLSERLRRVAGQMPLPLRPSQNEWTAMQWVTQVTIRAIDRDQRM